MDLGKVITSLMGTLCIGFCIVSAVLYMAPINQKIELDQICRKHMYTINVSEGLSNTQRLALTEDLEAMGLTDVTISCPAQGVLKRRQESKFTVKGTVKARVATGFLNFSEEALPYEFSASVFGKVIIN